MHLMHSPHIFKGNSRFELHLGIWFKLCRRFNSALMMETTYGHKVNGLDDEFVKFAQVAIEATVAAGSPGSMLVDFFPICR